MNYMLRSRWTRMIYKGKEIPCRPCTKTHYTRGDVVIVNDNLAHYRGEIQIVLKDMKVDGQRNLLGRIDESEIFILEHIKAKDIYDTLITAWEEGCKSVYYIRTIQKNTNNISEKEERESCRGQKEII